MGDKVTRAFVKSVELCTIKGRYKTAAKVLRPKETRKGITASKCWGLHLNPCRFDSDTLGARGYPTFLLLTCVSKLPPS